jgi:hypothetical protein
MKCLAQWDVELKMVRKFTVITDHTNLSILLSGDYCRNNMTVGQTH